jgi:hypothetical protein
MGEAGLSGRAGGTWLLLLVLPAPAAPAAADAEDAVVPPRCRCLASKADVVTSVKPCSDSCSGDNDATSGNSCVVR